MFVEYCSLAISRLIAKVERSTNLVLARFATSPDSATKPGSRADGENATIVGGLQTRNRSTETGGSGGFSPVEGGARTPKATAQRPENRLGPELAIELPRHPNPLRARQMGTSGEMFNRYCPASPKMRSSEVEKPGSTPGSPRFSLLRSTRGARSGL